MIHMIFIFTFFLLSGAGSVQAADVAAQEEAFLAFSECRREQVRDAYTILSNFAGSVGVSIAMNSLHMLTPENQKVLCAAAAFKEAAVFDDAFLTGYIERYQKTIDTRYFNGLMAALVIIAAQKLCDDNQPRYYPRKTVKEVPL